jgi:hypothetical protein
MTLEELIGRNVERLRTAAGARQEDVAAAAKAHGLTWGRSSVANLEAGRAATSAVEFMLLPSIMRAATGQPTALADLLAPVDGKATTVDLTDVIAVKASTLALSLTAGAAGIPLRALQVVADADEATQKAARKLGITPEQAAAVALKLWGRRLSDVRDARAAARTPKGASPRSVQAIRGQVSRELIAELAAAIGNGEV